MNVTAIQENDTPVKPEDYVLKTDCRISGLVGQECRRRNLQGEEFPKKAQMEFIDKELMDAIVKEPDLGSIFAGLKKEQQRRAVFLLVRDAMNTKKKKG